MIKIQAMVRELGRIAQPSWEFGSKIHSKHERQGDELLVNFGHTRGLDWCN